MHNALKTFGDLWMRGGGLWRPEPEFRDAGRDKFGAEISVDGKVEYEVLNGFG